MRQSLVTRIAARIVVSALIITAPGLDPYQAFGQVSRAVIGARTVNVRLAPSAVAVGPRGILSGVGINPVGMPASASVPAQAAAGPAAKEILAAEAAGVLELTDLKIPQAQVKSQAGKTFEGEGVKKTAADGVDLSAAGKDFGGVLNSLSPALARPAGPVRLISKPATAAYDEKQNVMPKLAVAAGVMALGWGLAVLGVPLAAPLMGLALPLAFGVLNGRRGGGAEPGPKLVEAFLEKISAMREPGERIDPELELQIGTMLGIDQATTNMILGELALQGRLAVLSNGTFIYTQARQRALKSNPDPFIQGGDKQAAKGLALLNNPEGGDAVLLGRHAQALYAFEQALQIYEKSKEDPRAAKADVQVLRDNALVAVAADVSRLYDLALSVANEDEHLAGKAEFSRALGAWVKEAYFDVRHRPDALSPEHAVRLLSLLNSMGADIPKYDAVEGLALARGFFNSYLMDSDRAQAPGQEAAASEAVVWAPVEAGAGFQLVNKTLIPTLAQFSRPLSQLAVEGKLTPLIGRRDVIRKMAKVLIRTKKNNPVLIGEPGVGKTAIVEGLAQAIVSGEVPELAGKNIFQLDMTALVAGTKYRGEFEERVKKILQEVKELNGRAVLYLDEMHSMVGAGDSEGGQDASGMLKEALSRGDIKLIGSTTLLEYRTIEKDAALARRVQDIQVAIPSEEEAVEILRGSKAVYEKNHQVTIADEAIKAAVSLAARYVPEKNLPDSAFDLLDDAAGEVRLKAAEAKLAGKPAVREVGAADVSFEVAERTGIPVDSLNEADLSSLKSLREDLDAQVIAQPEATKAVADAIVDARLGYKDAKQPIGAFLFLGPTGVGKTEVARVLAKKLFHSESNIVRIDMSEYQGEESISRLIGSAPGLVGYGDPGQLTEPVRRKKHTVVLLDEIEKADPAVLNLLLQVFEDGRLTDSQGHLVNFSNTVIILTSNIGGSLAQGEKDAAKRKERYLAALKAKLPPELINRIGIPSIIVFNNLEREEDFKKILDMRVAELNETLKAKDLSVTLTGRAKNYLVARALSPENRPYGARPIKHLIKAEVRTALVQAELGGKIKKGDRVTVDYNAETGITVQRGDPTSWTVPLGGFSVMALAAAGTLSVGWALSALSAAAGIYWVHRRYKSAERSSTASRAPPLGKLASLLRWALPVLAMTALVYGVDVGTKILAEKFLHTQFHEAAWRAPFMAVIMPYIGFTAYKARAPIMRTHKVWCWSIKQVFNGSAGFYSKTVPGLDAMVKEHPSLHWAMRLYDISIALMLGGLLGNGIDLFRLGGALDWIPVGRSLLNFADVALLSGLALFSLWSNFFNKVGETNRGKKPLFFSTVSFLGMPLVGFFLAWTLGTKESGGAFDIALKNLGYLYLMAFSMLVGITRYLAALVVNRSAADFNKEQAAKK